MEGAYSEKTKQNKTKHQYTLEEENPIGKNMKSYRVVPFVSLPSSLSLKTNEHFMASMILPTINGLITILMRCTKPLSLSLSLSEGVSHPDCIHRPAVVPEPDVYDV